MNVMIPVRPDGSVEPRLGKAPMVAVAQVNNDGHITDWHTFQVEWDRLHDEGTEGSHHARIVRFLREHDVVACVATHAGMGMQRTLAAMKVPLLPATLPRLMPGNQWSTPWFRHMRTPRARRSHESSNHRCRFYGAALVDAGMDVSFIARGKTLIAIREHGLRLVGNTELTLDVPVTDNAAEIGQVDVVLLCTKTFQVAEAARTYLPALMGPHTLVVTTQNGVIAPHELSAIIGPEHVAPGVCRQWVKIVEPGLIMDLGGPRMFEVSTIDDSPNTLVNELREACRKGGLTSPDVENITTTLWVKMCSVVPQGACGAVLDVSLGDLLGPYRDVFARCIDETVQVARAHSARIADDFVEKNLTFLAGQDPASTTSFQRDILAGRPSEYAAQVGAVPRLGDEVGVDTPINDVIAAVLGRREAQNRA